MKSRPGTLAVAGVGDLDGDGCDDVVVGAPDSWKGLSDTPSAYLWMGPGEADGYFRSSDAFVGAETNRGCLGASVAPGPDGDGDGVADVLLGAQCWGEVDLFSGDVSAVPDGGWTPGEDELARFYVPEDEVKGSSDDETLNELSRFGFRLAAADVNGDGVGDVVASAPYPGSSTGDDDPSLGVIAVFHGPFDGGGAPVSYEDADQAISGSWDSSALFGVDEYPDLELGVGLSHADFVVAGGRLIIEGTSRSYQQSKDNAGWLFLGPFEAGSFERGSPKEWPTC